MATLTDDELGRIKREVLDNVLGTGALPYISVKAVYDLIRDNVSSSSVSATTSSTSVTSTGPTVLTLASITGYAAPQRIQVDVDQSREVVTINNVSGSTVAVNLSKTHSGTYRVEVESPLTIVRGLLSDLTYLETLDRGAWSSLGLKRVDEVEWFGPSDGGDLADRIAHHRDRIRGELARACGISWVLAQGRAFAQGGGSYEVY